MREDPLVVGDRVWYHEPGAERGVPAVIVARSRRGYAIRLAGPGRGHPFDVEAASLRRRYARLQGETEDA